MHLKNIYLLFCLFLILGEVAICQDPWRFREEIVAFEQADLSLINKDNLIVFTGSSSVRFWPNLDSSFVGYNVINRGFGGSVTSDLDYFWDKLIYQYNPSKVFIYEGDNDIFAGKSLEDIMKSMESLISKIKKYLPHTSIYVISPKPSVARWSLKEKYEQLNYKLALQAMWDPKVTFIDVWTPMLTEDGSVMTDIFIEDNLHMNLKGYSIWTEVIKPFVEEEN
jgi:lysophospholipase L1-like esterase